MDFGEWSLNYFLTCVLFIFCLTGWNGGKFIIPFFGVKVKLVLVFYENLSPSHFLLEPLKFISLRVLKALKNNVKSTYFVFLWTDIPQPIQFNKFNFLFSGGSQNQYTQGLIRYCNIKISQYWPIFQFIGYILIIFLK